MKIQSHQRRQRGFTLIEMIGVLAVIAILAALLVPKIFESINNARISNATITLNTIKTAVADHYSKTGSLVKDASGTALTFSGTPAVSADFDGVLLREGFLDKPFELKISNDSGVDIKLLTGVASDTDVDGTNAAFDLDGSTASPSLKNEAGPATAVVAAAVIPGVSLTDAQELSKRLDGDNLSTTSGDDFKGRVKYAAPASGSSTTTVYVYLTHR